MGSSLACTTCIKAGGVQVHRYGVDVEDFYDLEEALGQGGYAVVRRCRCRRSKVNRACKMIDKSRHPDPALLPVEVDTLVALQHGPGSALIARLFEVFEDGKHMHLILELCAGGELYELQRKVGNFSEANAAVLLRQMLSALVHIHGHYVMHRDLKLENWLVADTDTLSIKLSDFGLSIRLLPGQRAHDKVGSPYYVAPEVLDGDYDACADIWSLGIIMYILLSGAPPFNGKDQAEILKSVYVARLSFPSRSWYSISKSARTLVRSLLARDSSCRPSLTETIHAAWFSQAERMGMVSASG